MGNIFACLIRSQVNTFSLGSLSHNYAKRCTSCAARQYTSSDTCRFCGGNVVDLDPADAAHHREGDAGDGRNPALRRAAHNANVLSAQTAGHSIPVILAHDPETNGIIRYVQDHRGMLIRISGPTGDGRSMRSDHPDAILESDGLGSDHGKAMDVEKLQQELDYLPRTNDGGMEEIEQAVRDLADMVEVDNEASHLSPSQSSFVVPTINASTCSHNSTGLRLRSIGSGRMTESGARIAPLLQQHQAERSMRRRDVTRDTTKYTSYDIAQALEHTRQLLSCPVCLSEYNAPLTLPCGHSLCATHLGDVAKQSASCPICREAIPPCLVKLGRYLKSRELPTVTDTSAGKEARDDHGRRVVIMSNPHTCIELSGTEKGKAGMNGTCGGECDLPAEIIGKIQNEDLVDNVDLLRRLADIAEERQPKLSSSRSCTSGRDVPTHKSRQAKPTRATKQKSC